MLHLRDQVTGWLGKSLSLGHGRTLCPPLALQL